MDFYKKNPVIKGTIYVQGKEMNDDTVVCGEEFRMFADPATFPNVPVRLVRVDFNALNADQVAQVQGLSKEQAARPPRHLPPIMSEQFSVSSMGELKPIPKVEEKKDVIAEKKAEKLVVSKADKSLTEVFTMAEFINAFPGVTEENAENILAKFKTLRDFANATNVDLRTVGVRSNFFVRLRNAATEALQEYEDEE